MHDLKPDANHCLSSYLLVCVFHSLLPCPQTFFPRSKISGLLFFFSVSHTVCVALTVVISVTTSHDRSMFMCVPFLAGCRRTLFWKLNSQHVLGCLDVFHISLAVYKFAVVRLWVVADVCTTTTVSLSLFPQSVCLSITFLSLCLFFLPYMHGSLSFSSHFLSLDIVSCSSLYLSRALWLPLSISPQQKDASLSEGLDPQILFSMTVSFCICVCQVYGLSWRRR